VRKKLLALSAVGVIALMMASALPALAVPPQEAAGEWHYVAHVDGVKIAGCNTYLTIYEDSVLSGTFDGTADDRGTVVLHCSGDASYNAILTFEEVTVDGKTGSMVMSINGRAPAPATMWQGNWVILSATGELAGLHGQGAWWGPGAGGPGLPGFIEYDGNYHFKSNK
jgi:hypothetical protein